MALDQKAVIEQIDDVWEKCRTLTFGLRPTDFVDKKEEVMEAATLLFSAIRRLAPPGSTYVRNAEAQERFLRGQIGAAVAPLTGILNALRTDYKAGYLKSVTELIHADVFGDFIEMAEHLLEQGYKDPAAVLLGSVLEEHLRKLCDKNGIVTSSDNGTPKKADSLNSELAAASVYSKLDQKSVTAWLDLRNKAAHGKYEEYRREQVMLALQGVRDFVSRHPA